MPSSHRFRTTAKRNTTAAGYGYAHQRERARRLPLFTPAHPCGYCQRPLGPERLPGGTSLWALPHNADRTGYLPGFWHKRCNDLDGARRGARRVNARRLQRRVTSRTW